MSTKHLYDKHLEQRVGRRFVAFAGPRLVAAGDLRETARGARRALDQGVKRELLVFDAESSEPLELDLRGSVEQVLARLPGPTATSRGPGRPRLGVVAREVTLLPRHWEWLAAQPGGASAALRRLVEQARTASAGNDRRRRALDSAYRFMSATLGDQHGFEEATRALFACDAARFTARIAGWPRDLRDHAAMLAATAFDA
jgi:uncharacterized protein